MKTGEAMTKDLVLKIEGKVLSSNFETFQKSALAIVDSINTELVTDNDFLDAEQTIKSCKETEDILFNAKQKAVHSTEDISNLFTLIDQLTGKIRDTRLSLEKSVKSEKLKRKNDVIAEGERLIRAAVEDSPIKFAFTVDIKAIQDAVKGKRSIEKMEQAVEEVVFSEIEAIETLEMLFSFNKLLVDNAESEWPGLFPDWKTICLTATETVEQSIEARINKFKLNEQEKKQREAERMEAARLATIEAEAQVVNFVEPTVEEVAEYEEPTYKAPEEVNDYVLTVQIHGRRFDALAISEKVDEALVGFDCVVGVKISKSKIAA